MLHHIKEDNIKVVLAKPNNLLSKTQGLQGVCCLHGLSVISGKVCIIMKFYEGSVGDKMASLKGGKCSLAYVLRCLLLLKGNLLIPLFHREFGFESIESSIKFCGIPCKSPWLRHWQNKLHRFHEHPQDFTSQEIQIYVAIMCKDVLYSSNVCLMD